MHTLISTSSVVRLESCLWNHGGLLNEQQLLRTMVTTTPIPQWIVGINCWIWWGRCHKMWISRFTKIVTSYKGWWRCVTTITGTKRWLTASTVILESRNKCPDVLSWSATSEANTIHIVALYICTKPALECISSTDLIRSDSATDS